MKPVLLAHIMTMTRASPVPMAQFQIQTVQHAATALLALEMHMVTSFQVAAIGFSKGNSRESREPWGFQNSIPGAAASS